MPKIIDLRVSPREANESDLLHKAIGRACEVPYEKIAHFVIERRSIDARKRQIKVNLRVNVYFSGEPIETPTLPTFEAQNVAASKQRVIIVGAGPAGLFAALRLIELGKKPIIIERGKEVKERRRDLARLTKEHIVDPDSNYCFGEGGAGTYSDGKLYTRSKKRGDIARILERFVAFGADQDILVEAHPHIGTNKLPAIISSMTEKIIERGGEVHFNTKVVDFVIKNEEIQGIVTQNGDTIEANKMILATGHSARDIFELLNTKKILIEAKPFALGVRIEHPQELIDQIQYSCKTERSEHLPPASYRLVRQINGRGVYSFCMCPGGVIAPCSTQPGEVVTNGWSPSKRDQKTANSGIVVELKMKDFARYARKGELSAMHFQAAVEQKAWKAAGETQAVPAQRMVDFVNGKKSINLPTTSYFPGLASVELGSVLPKFVYQSLQHGFRHFGKNMPGYLSNEAIVHAPESRTSSPVRIPRNSDLQHPQIKGFFPCGEGAGYAGGILSAAMDGERCANACFPE